jgi:AcrR family transcriptional regulator
VKKGDVTREKVMEVATREFAEFGLSGGRVERIANAIGMSKNHIYIHYGSKEALFAAVLQRNLERIIAEVPFTLDDLPAYCGALFDFAMANPDVMRLKAWYALEGRGIPLGAFLDGWSEKEDEMTKTGVPGRLPPEFMMKILPTLASAWTVINPFGPLLTKASPEQLAKIRADVVAATVLLTKS